MGSEEECAEGGRADLFAPELVIAVEGGDVRTGAAEGSWLASGWKRLVEDAERCEYVEERVDVCVAAVRMAMPGATGESETPWLVELGQEVRGLESDVLFEGEMGE